MPMYLSKLLLNPRSVDARRDSAAPYEMHRTLARAFPTDVGTNYRERHGVLFRMEPLAYRHSQPTILVQSTSEPDWSRLPAGYSLSIQSHSFTLGFMSGQQFQFRLIANPTKKTKREGKRQGHRIALPAYLTQETQREETTPAQDWLRRKGQLNGFEIQWASSDGFWHGQGIPDGSLRKQTLPLYGVRFDGVLQVTDPEKFGIAIQQGIGSAKAFGFGLLSLARF